MDKLLQIKGEVQKVKSSISEEVNSAKQELDSAMAKVEVLEAKWDPITLTDAKESFQNAQANVTAAVGQFVALQKRINGILKS